MIILLNLNHIDIADSVLELQRASYSVEAEIIGFYEIPPLKDSRKSLQECGETFYGNYVDDTLAGLISFKVNEDVLDIHRVAVHPKFFRRGIAQGLLHHAEKLQGNISKITVCTGRANLPAVNLYLKSGYSETRSIEISTGVYVTEFEKVL